MSSSSYVRQHAKLWNHCGLKEDLIYIIILCLPKREVLSYHSLLPSSLTRSLVLTRTLGTVTSWAMSQQHSHCPARHGICGVVLSFSVTCTALIQLGAHFCIFDQVGWHIEGYPQDIHLTSEICSEVLLQLVAAIKLTVTWVSTRIYFQLVTRLLQFSSIGKWQCGGLCSEFDSYWSGQCRLPCSPYWAQSSQSTWNARCHHQSFGALLHCVWPKDSTMTTYSPQEFKLQ